MPGPSLPIVEATGRRLCVRRGGVCGPFQARRRRRRPQPPRNDLGSPVPATQCRRSAISVGARVGDPARPTPFRGPLLLSAPPRTRPSPGARPLPRALQPTPRPCPVATPPQRNSSLSSPPLPPRPAAGHRPASSDRRSAPALVPPAPVSPSRLPLSNSGHLLLPPPVAGRQRGDRGVQKIRQPPSPHVERLRQTTGTRIENLTILLCWYNWPLTGDYKEPNPSHGGCFYCPP